MYNDSIETLLLRHYGNDAPVPDSLEQRLHASVRNEVAELQEQQRVTAHLRSLRVSRRRAVKLIALGYAGVSLLSVGLESLQAVEAALLGQDTTKNQPALSS